jgi:3-deoxy-7-phosphoheptulonate synthase
MNSILGGVHLELTGENVTECIGGSQNIQAAHLKNAYFSLMDPRLNREQSLEMAVALSHILSASSHANGSALTRS